MQKSAINAFITYIYECSSSFSGLLSLNDFDYIVIGASIEGLIFSEAVLKDRKARVAIIDRNSVPGGHWLHRPEFAQAGSPNAAIGLSDFTISDWNPGIRVSSRAEILDYCAHILQHRLLPSERFSYFPDCEYLGDGCVAFLKTGDVEFLQIQRSVVDASRTAKAPGAPHIPCFSVTEAVEVIHPTKLSAKLESIDYPYPAYCIIGAGRTALDVAQFLLSKKVSKTKIHWVKSREPWLLSKPFQIGQAAPLAAHFSASVEGLKAMAHAVTLQSLALDLERLGVLARVSTDHDPSNFYPHIIDPQKAGQLGTIKRVIRKGHVHAISEIGMVLDEGVVPMPVRTLYIDCTGSRGTFAAPAPVFQERFIRLTEVRLCRPSFSAAIIAAIELLDLSTADKNALCTPLQSRNLAALLLTSILNLHAWFHDDTLRQWLSRCRLDGFLQATAANIDASREIPSDLKPIRAMIPRAIINLEQLIEQSGAEYPHSV